MNNNQQKKINYPGIISLILAIIPYLLFAFCYIMSNGEGEDGAGAIIWLFVIYLWSVGIPIFIASVVFGILGLIKYKRFKSLQKITYPYEIYCCIISFRKKGEYYAI